MIEMSDASASLVPAAHGRRRSPIDLDAMRHGDGWREAPVWPCTIPEIRSIQDGCWRAMHNFLREQEPGEERDAVLLGVSLIMTRIIPLVETAYTLQQAEEKDLDLEGGPPEVDYLRGNWRDQEVPTDAISDTKDIMKARHPLVRNILSSRHLMPVWKIPFRLAFARGKAVAHNQLMFDMARRDNVSLAFFEAGSAFFSIRRRYSKVADQDRVDSLSVLLARRLIAEASIAQPYRERLMDLVVAKTTRILKQCFNDMAAMQKARLPKLLWGNTGAQYAARAMAIETLRRGGETRFFTHAGTSATMYLPYTMSLQVLAVSSDFVLETDKAANQPEMREIIKANANIQKSRIIGGYGNNSILKLPLTSDRGHARRPKVLYVGTPSRGFIRHGIKALPEVIFLDWQIRLANFMNSLPIDFLCKPHPSGYFGRQRHPIEREAPADYRRFEELMEDADVFLFDSCITTTIWETLCTDRKVIYFDLGLFTLNSQIDPMFCRRCHVIETTYDEDNRPHFDPDEVNTAIFDRREIDAGEFHGMLVG